MATTTNYNLTKPDVDSTGWGSDVNTNFDTIDTQMKANADAAAAAGGIDNIIEDTTPQLGGNLDMNGKNIQTVTPTEMAYLHGVTSALQSQIDGKQATGSYIETIVEDLSPQLGGNLDLNGNTISGLTATTLGYLETVTSPIQTQLNTKADKTVAIGIACSDETSDIEVSGVTTFRLPYAITLTDVRASVTTAPVGSSIICDITDSGSTILSTLLTIDAGEYTSVTATTSYVISDASLLDSAEIGIVIDQIGSSVAGSGLKVWLIGTRA